MKKLLSIVLAIVLMVSVCPLGLFTITASANTVTSGTSGDCTWSIDGTVLTISGNGEMGDYYMDSPPWYGEKITNVIIKNGVTLIGSGAFHGLSSLTNVTIPNSVTRIGAHVFTDCISLTSITIPNSVTMISERLFEGCTNITSITIPDSVISIGGSTFSGCTGLMNITMSDSVTSIEGGTFYDCTSLTSITIPKNVTTIGGRAFKGCTNLKSIVISDKLENVIDSAFEDCTNLKDVWYGGSESNKANISFTTYNGCLKKATWHYNTCESTKHTYSGECDKTCNNCEWVRNLNENISHTYDNACDSECNVCGFVRTVPDHVYDGEYDTDCNICGAVREVGSPNLEIYATNLVLKNNITVNYYVDKTLFDNAGYTKPYIEFVFNGATVIQKNYDLTSDGLYYVFKFDGVMPNQINDTVKAILHTKVGDNELSSLSSEYSVATYCYNMLNVYSDNIALRTLLVDLLNYGTTAQIYSDYNIKSLANAQLTETQKTWGTQTADMLSNVLNAKYTEIEDVTVRWKSVGVNLKDNVAVRFKMSAESKDNLTVKISTSSGDEWTLSNKCFEYAGNGCYYVYFEELNVCQMREKIYATVYEGDTAVSNTLCYSIESYVYSQQSSSNEKLKNLLDAMIKYGDSAYRYKQTEN